MARGRVVAGAIVAALAIHVLYRLPDPDAGVRELRRVLTDGGRLLAPLNGNDNLRELSTLVASVFNGQASDRSGAIVGLDQGGEILRRHLRSVELIPYPDDLIVTDPQEVVDYVLSFPRADLDAGKEQRLRTAVNDAFRQSGEVSGSPSSWCLSLHGLNSRRGNCGSGHKQRKASRLPHTSRA